MKQKLYYLFWLAGLMLLSSWAHAAEPAFREGVHYSILPPDLKENYTIQEYLKADSHPVQIIQFFNYGCHACNDFEPLLQTWLNNQDMTKIGFRRVPVVFHPAWRPLAKAYYTASDLGINATVDSAFFHAIHVEQKNLFENHEIQKIFTQKSVSTDDFLKTFDSFSVNRQMKEATQLAVAFRIPAIPFLVIQTSTGTYLTSPGMAGNLENTVAVLDWLIKNRQ